MRRIIVLSFLSLDGVMQAPGGPDEDTSGGFTHGGWVAPLFDGAAGQAMSRQMAPADLLLGRKTFDIFEGYWPVHAEEWPSINDVTKYVVSGSRTHSDWSDTSFLAGIDDVKSLKADEGRPLQVHGSGELVQALLKHDLVDELWLKFLPVTLGSGKRLFGEGTIPAAFKLTESFATPNGVIFANYTRAGELEIGSVSE